MVQDSDRPLYVVASDYQDALSRWGKLVAAENDCTPEDLEPPLGIQLIAGGDELIL